MSADLVGRLKSVLGNHPGSAAVFLELQNGTGHKTLKLSDDFRVEPRSALYAELGELLGPKAVAL
jgi:DNA polymerase-3 subunit alpha